MALSSRDRRALAVLGAVAGIAIVGFLLMNVLGGGGGEEAAAPPAVGGPTLQPSPTGSPSTPRETLPPVVLAGARDPFSPPPWFGGSSGGVSPSGTAPPPGTETQSPPGTATQSPGTGTGPGSTQTPPPTAPGGGASATMGGHTVVLVDIFDGGTKAQVEVDGTVYTVREGDAFGDNFRLGSIGGSCAQVQFGSEAATICLNPQK